MGDKNTNDRVASPESKRIHLKYEHRLLRHMSDILNRQREDIFLSTRKPCLSMSDVKVTARGVVKYSEHLKAKFLSRPYKIPARAMTYMAIQISPLLSAGTDCQDQGFSSRYLL